MKKTFAAAVLLAAAAAAQAVPTAPVGALNVALTEYTGAGPIGNNNLDDNANLYWIYEGTANYMGDTVHSWFLAWDPRMELTATGTVTFDQPVVALLGTRNLLVASAYMGNPGVTYDYSNLGVGLDYGDFINTSFSGNVLSLSWFSAVPGDHARILTQVPEPGTWALMLGGLAAVGSLIRRRSAN